MIERLRKRAETRSKYWDHLRTYRVLAFTLVPLFVLYIALEGVLDFEINIYQKSLVIYTASMLVIFQIMAMFDLFRKNFLIAHYSFLTGAMLLCLAWYNSDPGIDQSTSLILASCLVGVGIVHPKVTIGFYAFTIMAFASIGIYNGNLDVKLLVMLATIALVISGINFWRARMTKSLLNARETFKGIFDSSNNQIYVLSKDFVILDASKAAEAYLKANGEEQFLNKVFQEIFIAETEQCMTNFKNAVGECEKEGNARFTANCSIGDTSQFYSKEFFIRKGTYFEEDVYLLSVRVVHDQKEAERELLEHKDNVTQILENINYFVFNITFDKEERFKHHVNFVSNKVEEVYGYTVDEYISLVKSERIDKDRHPDDKEKINKWFDELLQSGGKGKWRFRLKRDDEWRWMEEKIFIQPTEDKKIASLFGMVKDVTEEIFAEEQLKESEKRYRQLFENNLAGVFKTSLGGQFIDCNLAFANILGYDSVEELKKMDVIDIYFDPKDREDYINKLIRDKQLNNYLTYIKRKDGRRLILNNNVSLLPDEQGEENIIIGSLVDVTDLHETTQALVHSEEKYRQLFEQSNNAILLLVLSDNESYVADANQTAQEMLGYAEDELVGQQLKSLLDPEIEMKEELAGIIKELEKNRPTETEWEFIRKDKSKFYGEVAFASAFNDDENVAQVIIKDISERKQYEKEILESRLSFKNIVDRSPASILIFSKNELVYVNPNGEDLFMNVLNSDNRNLFKVFPSEKHHLIKDLISEANNNINSYTEIELGSGDRSKKYSINVVNTTYNFEDANIFMLQDITLQTEYNIQKLRAEMAEETNISLQQEIKRHQRTQQSLVESTSRLKALFESAAHLYIISIDQEFNIVSFNQNFKNMVKEKLDKEVGIGVNFLELFPIEDYAFDRIVGRLKSVLAGAPSNMISTFKSLQGQVWMESFMSPILIEDREIKEISFISHDITEQVENRRRVLVSEDNNRALLLALPDLLFKANTKGVFTDFRASHESNEQAFQRIFNTEKVIGEKIEKVIHDENVASEIKEYINMALKTEQLVTHNFSVSGDDNEKVHFENRYSKVNDDEVVIISRNVTSTVEYEEKLIESVKEKEVLLKEVHHRVKNNLQVINSILNLQSSYVTDEETLQIIVESQNRIRSMSYIHESLYQTKDFSSINFQDYITNLVQNLIHSYEVYSDKTELDLKVDEVNLALDQAIPCGLILNELITNALKYAYPDQEKGKITIQVFEEQGKVFVKVQDFGVGLPDGFNISDTDSLGLSLVDTLIDQLDGELRLQTKGGTEFLIIFDKQEI